MTYVFRVEDSLGLEVRFSIRVLLHSKIDLPEGGVTFKGRPNGPGGKIGTSHNSVLTLGGRGAQNER